MLLLKQTPCGELSSQWTARLAAATVTDLFSLAQGEPTDYNLLSC